VCRSWYVVAGMSPRGFAVVLVLLVCLRSSFVCVCSKICLLRAKSSKRRSLGDVDNSRSALLLGNESRYCFDYRLS
jgi:hypothetical protein